MSCPFLKDDAAYVLGALDPDDRQRYEDHLKTCRTCTSAVRNLVGLPGLLARLTPDQVAATETEHEQPPPELLTALLRKANRERRGVRWRIGVAAAAVAASIATASTVIATHDTAEGPRAPVAAAVDLEPVGDWPVTASATLTTLQWGTSIEMRCEYTGDYSGQKVNYSLVVYDEDGKSHSLSDWQVIPNQEAWIQAGTAVPVDDIDRVEVQVGGHTVMRGDL